MNQTETWLTTTLQRLAGDGSGPPVDMPALRARRRARRTKQTATAVGCVALCVGVVFASTAARSSAGGGPASQPARVPVSLVVDYGGSGLSPIPQRYTSPHNIQAAAQADQCHAYWLNGNNQGGQLLVEVHLLINAGADQARIDSLHALPGVISVQQVPLTQFAVAPTGPGDVEGPLSCDKATLPAQDGVQYHGTDTTTLRMPSGFGFVVAPPAAGGIAGISWQQAYATCSHTAPCGPVGTQDIYLVRLTETTSNLTMRPDGTAVPNVNHRLVYLIVLYGKTCVSSGGPPPPPGSTPRAVTPSPCTQFAVVDADTGQDLGGGWGPP